MDQQTSNSPQSVQPIPQASPPPIPPMQTKKHIHTSAFVFLGVLLLGLGGLGGYYLITNQLPFLTTKACTMEAKLCPDGSSVGRTGPNCEFAPCPNPTGASPFPSGSSDNEISCSQDERKISVITTNSSKFVKNIFGIAETQYLSRTDYSWTLTSANNVILDLNTRLPETGWQVVSDWGHQGPSASILSSWKKGDSELLILLLDDLDTVGIDSLSKNYGIVGPVPKSTLCVTHFIDKSASR